jgi:zinc protease
MLFNKSLFFISAALFSWLFVIKGAIAIPKIESWHTDSGAYALFVPAPELPILDVQITFNAGSAREMRPGIANLTNSLLTQGAGEWNADQLAERLENIGARLSVGSLRDMAWVTLRTLTTEPAKNVAVQTLTAIVGQPKFTIPDLERLRKNTLVSINQDEQNPGTVGNKAIFRAIYENHPYANDPSGTKESVATISQTDVVEHYRRYYVAKNAVIAMVGAIDAKQAKQIAEQITKYLMPGELVSALPKVMDLDKKYVELIKFPATQSHVFVGQIGITRTDVDYFPLYVGNHILGGNGLVSILSNEIREQRGLSYNVSSSFSPMQERGPFIMGLQTKHNQVKQALEVLMQTFRQFLQNGPSEEELKNAKQNITGGFPLRISTNAKTLEYLASIGFYRLPLDYLDTYCAKVDAVTINQIRETFQRRIIPEHFATVIVGTGSN